MKHIVILGASYGGLGTAHRILKQATKTSPFKITLVSPNTDFFWNVASPRGIVPGKFADDQLFQPIAPGFERYPATRFEFILAAAESLDVEAKKVHITGPGVTKTLDYDFLILATGSRIRDGAPFKGLGTTEATKHALHDFQARVANAQTIVVAGGGVTSVETAGELGFEYGRRKKIYLIASGPTVLQESPESVSSLALKELRNLNIDVSLQKKVLSSVQLPDGRQELTLSTGEKLMADMYIPACGVLPNSSYVPSRFLNGDGFVIVDEYLKVKGAKDIWAIGDVSNVESPQLITCEKQAAYLAKSITSMLRDKPVVPYKVSTRFMGLQIGKSAGTGFYGSVRVPSFVIIMARKNLFTENLAPTVNGSLF